MPSPILLQRLSKFLQNSQTAIVADCQGIFNVGGLQDGNDVGGFSWPEQIDTILDSASLQLTAAANGEGWNVEEISSEEDHANLWAIQSLILEASAARNVFQRSLNRFQSSQDGQGGFIPSEMTEVRLEAMNIFDRLLSASLAHWIVQRRDEGEPEAAEADELPEEAEKPPPRPAVSNSLGSVVLPADAQVKLPSGITTAALKEIRDGIFAVSSLVGKLRVFLPSGTDDPAVQAVRRLQRMATLLESIGGMDPPRATAQAPEPIRVAPLAVRAFMDALAEAFRPLAEQKGLRLAMICDAGLTSVETDAPKLHRAASLLIGNAVQYTMQGGVSLAARGSGADWALTVEDTGPGIDPDKLGKLLTGQALGPDRIPHGIAVARELVQMLGGHLDADSVQRRGCRFTIRLPRGKNTPPLAAAVAARRPG